MNNDSELVRQFTTITYIMMCGIIYEYMRHTASSRDHLKWDKKRVFLLLGATVGFLSKTKTSTLITLHSILAFVSCADLTYWTVALIITAGKCMETSLFKWAAILLIFNLSSSSSRMNDWWCCSPKLTRIESRIFSSNDLICRRVCNKPD